MGEGVPIRPLKTHIIHGGESLRVLQNFDAGCGKEAAATAGREPAPTCEFHEYYEEYRQGAWVSRVSRRFGNGPTQKSERTTQGTPPGEGDLWNKAEFKLDLARRISAWSLQYLGEALRSGGLTNGTIPTSMGAAIVTPLCTSANKLTGITLFYSVQNIQFDFTDHPAVAVFESKLCRKPTHP